MANSTSKMRLKSGFSGCKYKAWFRRRISVASNAIQTIDNEVSHLIIYCLNCIRRDGNSTSKMGLSTSIETEGNTIGHVALIILYACSYLYYQLSLFQFGELSHVLKVLV